MNLYLSYNNEGFAVALQNGTDESFNKKHSLAEQLEQIIAHAEYDMAFGYCHSYEIYNQDGEIIFSKEQSRIA